MIVNLALAAISSLAIHYYFKLPPMQSIIVAIAIFVGLNLVNVATFEGFSSASTTDNVRNVRFGDRITLWTHKNRFMRMHKKKYADSSVHLNDPSEIPRTWIWELFKIEDATDDRYMMGSQSPVRYGDKIYLRSWLSAPRTGMVWLSPSEDEKVEGRRQRKTQEIVTLESPDITGSSGQPLKYGDPVYLKTWRGQYICHPETGGTGYARMKQTSKKDHTCVFRIYDDYGQGQIIDWATRGTAAQAEQYSGYRASNAINGNTNSYSHTQNVQNAWWKVELPRDINVSEIRVVNRKDAHKERLRNFDVVLLDHDGKPVYTKYFQDTQASYELTGINRTGRAVKVQLRGKDYLNLSKVEVYGTPIHYSSTMETPVVADLITSTFDMTSDTAKQFHHDAIPYIGKSNSFSLTAFVKPKSNNSEPRNIVAKGDLMIQLDKENKLLVNMATARGQATLKSSASLSSEWNHVGVSVRPTISPESGWLYGEFSSTPAGVTESCCYVVHPQRREYYRLMEQGEFAKAVKNTWSAQVVKGMKNMGSLTQAANVPMLTIYINGDVDGEHKLNSDVRMTNSPLIVGQTGSSDHVVKSMIGQIRGLRMYNYDVSKETAYRDSRSQHSAQTLDLIRSEVDASSQTTINANMLPTIQNQVSVGFWFKNQSTNAKRQPIFVYGNKEHIMGMWLTENNTLYATVRVVGGTISGIKEIKYDMKPSVWYHVAMTLEASTQTVYINGKRIASTDLPSKVSYGVAPLTVGPYVGKIRNFRFYNYSLSDDEVKVQVGVHPNYKEQEIVQRMWHEQGCVTDLYDDIEANSEFIKMIKEGKDEEVETQLKAIKDAAHDGDAKKLEQCYGSYTSTLFSKLKKSGELLKHSGTGTAKKCLPTAPFTCTDRTVNDFDIRTHGDFHKYTLTENIIPPDHLGIGDGAGENFKKFAEQLAKSKLAVQEISKLRNQSVEQNKILTEKLKQLKESGTRLPYGTAEDDIRKHPLYMELQAESERLTKLMKEQESTMQSVKDASVAAKNVREHPEYKKIAKELKDARKLAMSSVAKDMDLETIRQTPAFQEILKEVQGIANRETDLDAQKQQLEKIRSDTMVQLKNTKQLASDIFHGIGGLDDTMVDNIISSKEDLSNNSEYQAMIEKMKLYGENGDIKQHPEYQKLVNKLNKMTTSHVDGESDQYQELKVQAHKCKAMFESGDLQDVSNLALVKMFKERVKTDSEFKALAANVVESKSASDPDFRQILQRAQDENYSNSPAFKEFLMKVTRDQIKNNPVYARMVAQMIGLKRGTGMSSARLEDHPEYNKYASDIRRECNA